VCPNHLCKQVRLQCAHPNHAVVSTLTLWSSPRHVQWENEIKKHTNPRLKTYVVNTARGHEKISYKDVINADVVIVSFTFLRYVLHFFLSGNVPATGGCV